MSKRSKLFRNWTLVSNGSYGRIYSVDYPLDGQTYAIKCIRTRKDRDILKEVRILATINHPNICRYYGSWIDTIVHKKVDNSDKYIEYMSNDDQHNHCTALSSNDTNILCIQMKLYDMNLTERMCRFYSKHDVKKWMTDILCGIRELRCHGFIHSDLCPRNILLDTKTNDVVLSDFGDVSDPMQTIYHPVTNMIHRDIYAAFVISIELTYHFHTQSERITKLRDAMKFIQNDDSTLKSDYILLIRDLTKQFPELLYSDDINRIV